MRVSPERLPAGLAPMLEEPLNTPVFSVASLWELVIKQALGRPDFKVEPSQLRRALPPLHRDPFDLLLLAQARADGFLLITVDQQLAVYPGLVRLMPAAGCAGNTTTGMIILIVIWAVGVASSPSERVTVTMPAELVAGIDRVERNRSRFIAEAVRHELQRRRRVELLRSLEEPHPDSLATAALGLERWSQELPACDSDLLDPMGGVPLDWSAEQGWQEPEA